MPGGVPAVALVQIRTISTLRPNTAKPLAAPPDHPSVPSPLSSTAASHPSTLAHRLGVGLGASDSAHSVQYIARFFFEYINCNNIISTETTEADCLSPDRVRTTRSTLRNGAGRLSAYAASRSVVVKRCGAQDAGAARRISKHVWHVTPRPNRAHAQLMRSPQQRGALVACYRLRFCRDEVARGGLMWERGIEGWHTHLHPSPIPEQVYATSWKPRK